MIKNYIFDFDGTLMDTAPVILATMQATIAEMHLPARSEAVCRATIGLVLTAVPGVLYPDREEMGAAYAEVYRRIFPIYNRPGAVKAYPRVVETLHALSERGCGLAIASSRGRHSLADFVRDIHLDDAFRMIVAGDDVKRGKPAPDPVLLILERLNWRAEETLVVGDAAYDILMGRAAGTKTCGVTYGNGSRAELIEAEADCLIDDFGELLTCKF